MTDADRLLACTTALLADPRPTEEQQFDLLASLVASWCLQFASDPRAAADGFVAMLRDVVVSPSTRAT